MTFQAKGVAKLTAKYTGSQNTVTFHGITTANDLTPETAKTQADKILTIVGRSCVTTGMTRTRTEEATE